MKRGVRRDHKPVGSEVAIPCPDNRVEHGFVEQAIAHPLGDYDVDVRDGQRDLFDFASEAAVTGILAPFAGIVLNVLLDDVAQVVCEDVLACFVNDVRIVHSYHLGRTRSRAEHGQDACSTADI